jgi:protein-tyrosine phosphatase
MASDRFVILAVCHANLCRSPLIEGLMRRAVSALLGAADATFEVSSAGTHARPGTPMHPHSAAVLREWGGDEANFRTRALGEEAIARADLIITADRAHRTLCVSMVPSAVERTFTVRQFGRLASVVDPASLPEGPPAARARALVLEAHLARALFQPVSAEEDDLPDPLGGPVEAFRECARQIDDPVGLMVNLLAPR